jgi:hypothetical protein
LHPSPKVTLFRIQLQVLRLSTIGVHGKTGSPTTLHAATTPLAAQPKKSVLGQQNFIGSICSLFRGGTFSNAAKYLHLVTLGLWLSPNRHA